MWFTFVIFQDDVRAIDLQVSLRDLMWSTINTVPSLEYNHRYAIPNTTHLNRESQEVNTRTDAIISESRHQIC